MKLLQSVSNITWTIHEKGGTYILVIWQGDGCDKVYSMSCTTEAGCKDALIEWFTGVIDGTITIPEGED